MILLQPIEPGARHSLCSHACHTASSELRVGIDPGWVVVTFKGGEGAFCSFVRAELETVSWDVPWFGTSMQQQHTLIAVSGIILITFNPLPVGEVSINCTI